MKKKTTVEIYDGEINESCLFKGKLRKIINEELNDYGFENAELIELICIGMTKKGYGQYNIIVEIAVNGFEWTIKEHSTDSQLYDKIYNDEVSDQTLSNTLKSVTLSVLSRGVERLVGELRDNNVVVKMEVESINK